jgi:hypothetical protein
MKKKFLLLVWLLTAASIFAQRTPANADRNAPPPADPTQLNDFEPPVLSCLQDLQVSVLAFTAQIQIGATDILMAVSDNVTPAPQILLGMRRAGTGTGFPWESPGQPADRLVFGCDDTDQPVLVELWAMDAAGNTAVCETELEVWDAWGVCHPDQLGASFCIQSFCSQEGIEETEIHIDGQSPFAPPFSYFDLTNEQGCGYIPKNIPIASTFLVSVQKDDNPLNGVTTADLVLLSQHIHGIQPFTEPWQWVAADVNGDLEITLEDSIELHKLILGVYTELPENTSWRFIPAGYQFPAPNPLAQPFPENLLVETIVTDMDTLFLGVKIGDLNCSATNFNASPQADRNASPPSDPTQLNGPPTDNATEIIEICIDTEQLCGVEELDIQFDGENQGGLFIVEDVSDEPGGFCPYRYEVTAGSNFQVAPVKDDNPLNGVTTYDLVLISKHIQGIEPLNSPYKIIAADADNNGVIDLNDSIELSRLILGIYNELPNNTSWRFVRKDYVFPNPFNPFAEVFPEHYAVANLQSPVSADFVAIKVGDVNGTAVCNSLVENTDRTNPGQALIGLPQPNPATDRCEMTVHAPEAGIGQCSLSDLNGRVLWRVTLPFARGANRIALPVADLPLAGVYIWEVKVGSEVKNGKIVKL